MASPRILPLGREHLPAAARLLAARQRRLRSLRPELPAAFEEPGAHLPALETLMGRLGAHGVVAREEGAEIGFLAGYPRSEPIWRRAAWSPIEGVALADGADPEVVRDLYAAWAEHFVRLGYFRQYVHVAADEAPLIDAWFHHWLVEESGRALAAATFYAADRGPMVPEGAWELSVAMTRPEARRRGLVRGLVAAGFGAARSAGATHCVTDWRTAALPTHRAWMALGFRPTHFRLHRHVDERIVWARGRPD